MKKQKKILTLIFIGCFSFVIFAGKVQATGAGSATVSWVPPTTDQGGGTLTGLAGYKVYYDTSSHWASTCPAGLGTAQDVPGGTSTKYFFNGTLTPGQTYYFAVVAYDDASTPNISGCATGTGGVTEVSKPITYSGDLNKDCTVSNLDYTYFHNYYNTSNSTADMNGDGTVNSTDYTYIHADYNKSFTPCNQ